MRILLFIGLSLFTTVAYAVKIEGKVTSSTHEPLSFANVTLLDKETLAILTYDTTKEDGSFSLNYQAGSFILKVSFLGFGSQELAVELREDLYLDFMLEEDQVLLDEITIEARKTGITYSQDTIRYEVKHFTDGSEQVLGDILKKMPGIEVDEKGGVKAQGKNIEKILLNGQDFYGGSTQVATKNLSADYAESIEILNNYSEYSLLEGFQSKEQTVLNVGVGKHMLDKLSGHVSMGGGIENKYELKGNLMYLKSKSMFSVIESVNNTGSEVFNIEDYIRLQGGLKGLISNDYSSINSFSLSAEEKKMLIPRQDIYKQTNGITALNMALQPTNKLKINSYFLLNHNKDHSDNFNRYLYESAARTEENQGEKARNMLYNGNLKIDYAPTASSLLTYAGSFMHTNYQLLSTNEQYFDRSSLFATEDWTNKTTQTSHNILWLKELNRNLFTVNGAFSYAQKPSDYRLETDTMLLPLAYKEVEDLYYLSQKKQTKEKIASLHLSHAYKLSPEFLLVSSLKTDYFSQSFYNYIHTPDDKNSLETSYMSYTPSVLLIKSKGFLRFKLGVEYARYHYNKLAGADLQKNLSRFNPILDLSLHFSNRHVLGVKHVQTNAPINLESFIQNTLINDFQSYLTASSLSKSIANTYKTNLTYRYFDLFSNTMLIVIGGHDYIKNSFTNNYEYSRPLSVLTPISSKPSQSFFLKSNLSKGLNFIPWTFKLLNSVTYSKIYNEQSGLANRIQTNNYDNEVQLLSTYTKQLLNYELKYRVQHFKTKTSLLTKNSQNIQGLAGKLKFDFKSKLHADVEFEYLKNKTSQFGTKNYYVLNSSVKYKFNKNFELLVSASNLLNLKKQTWYSSSYRENYILERSYRQIPGHLMLKLNVLF